MTAYIMKRENQYFMTVSRRTCGTRIFWFSIYKYDAARLMNVDHAIRCARIIKRAKPEIPISIYAFNTLKGDEKEVWTV